MNREAILSTLEASRLVPVLRAPSEDVALRAADALVAGGIRVLEVTLTVPGAVSMIRTLAQRSRSMPESERVIVGAGTVLTVEDAEACIEAGAQFVVTPGLSVPLVQRVRERQVPIMPGALTPTEVITAWQAGADMVKVFPCSAMGGAGYLRSLRAPLPQVKLFPTGGVKLENVHEYLAAGASVLGVGANLVDIDAVLAGESQRLTERAREYVEAVVD